MSQTQLSNISSLAGLVVLLLSQFGYGIDRDGVAFVLAALWSVSWTCYNWYQRWKKGDISLGGFRKN